MTVPSAQLVQAESLPFVEFDDSLPFVDEGKLKLQLLQVDIEVGLWVIRTLFAPGTTIQRHRHTGPIYAFTHSGSWYYKEYPDDVNVKGSYLFEPAGSIHTLHVPASNTEDTEVYFVMNGANLNLTDDDNVESVLDAGVITDVYLSMCEASGHSKPAVLGL